MEHDFWLDGWKKDHKPFHQTRINPHLQTWWPRLDPGPGKRVFVPLCGRSLDMLWIARSGRSVLGVELAPEPLIHFFQEADLEPLVRQRPPFVHYQAPGLELLQGDFFALGAHDLGEVGAWYDRAALPALPPEMRRRYADRITALLPPGTRGLLIVPVYDQVSMTPPPFSIDQPEVEGLFGTHWSLERVHDEATPVANRFADRGLKALRERVYLLERRPV